MAHGVAQRQAIGDQGAVTRVRQAWLPKAQSAPNREFPNKIVSWSGGHESFDRRARSDASIVRSARMLKIVEQTRTLTRQDLRAAIYDCCPQLSRAEAREIFDATFEELAVAILRGESVKLRGFVRLATAKSVSASGAIRRPASRR